MKQHSKRILAVLCALALMAGTAVATSVITTRQIEVQYMGIETYVNGSPVTLKGGSGQTLEPFVYNGDTYVPVRALAEALGKSVAWDSDTKRLSVGKAPMVESAEQLVSYLEDSHPAFALNAVPEGYSKAKEDFLALASKPDCTLPQFCLAAMGYTASLGDGHTAIDAFGNSSPSLMDVNWVADGDRLYLLDESGKPAKLEVLKVGGVATADLFAFLDTIVPSENQSARDRNHTRWGTIYNILALSGVQFSSDYSMVLTVKDGDKTVTRTVPLAKAPAQQPDPQPVITTKTMGDVFYADFNQCVPGAEMDAAVAALAQAVERGTTKVILDVRGNGGGASSTCEALLSAMGMEAPMYGMYLRYSPLAQESRGYDESTGEYRFDRHPETAVQNSKIKLVVLTDEDTYSSATMLGVFVQDGKLGTVIGRASANSPNSYGDILSYTLTNGIRGTVSHKQWLRPDAEADPTVLRPDVETAVGEDSLQTALAFLAK